MPSNPHAWRYEMPISSAASRNVSAL